MGPLILPVKWLLRVFEKLAARSDEENCDEGPIKRELMDLYLQLEAGLVSEAEFDEREAVLVKTLEEIEQRKKRRKDRGAG